MTQTVYLDHISRKLSSFKVGLIAPDSPSMTHEYPQTKTEVVEEESGAIVCGKCKLKEPCTCHEPLPECCAMLAATKHCGLFILIDKMLKKETISHSSVRLALDLLRSIHHRSVVVAPSRGDNPPLFVAKMIQAAEQFALYAYDTPLYTSAKSLVEAFAGYQANGSNFAGLEQQWQDFSLLFFREKLYCLMQQRAS